MNSQGDNSNSGQFRQQIGGPQSRSQFTAGQILDEKYEVISLLGEGGMGKVYKVQQIFLGKFMALKVLDGQQAINDVQIRRFQLEAKAAFALNHPNLVRVYDSGLLEGHVPYLVMDFIDGITLHDYIKRNGPITPEQAIKVFLQACAGLAYAHQQSIYHRDVKPSNIMLDANSNLGARNAVKIFDFGIAKFNDGGEIQALTRTGEIFGSPFYMSPEQCSGEKVDNRSDIYSLGCSLFEALTGTPPHVGPNALRTMMLHQSAPAPQLKEASLGKSFPDGLELIVQRMLRKNPLDRYQNLDDVISDLNDLAAGDKVKTSAPLVNQGAQSDQERMYSGYNVSMKPMKFFLLILAIVCGTSCVSIFAFKLYQNVEKTKSDMAEVAKQKIEIAKAEKRKIADVETLLDFSEYDKEQAGRVERFKRDFDNAAPIVGSIVTNGGVAQEVISFPSVFFGYISNQPHYRDQLVNNRGVNEGFETEAIGNVTLTPSKFLRLILRGKAIPGGSESNFALRHPSILKKVSPDLFDELEIAASPIDLKMSDAFGPEQQSKNLNILLKNATSWTKLRGVYINQFKIGPEAWSSLDEIKRLLALDLSDCQFNEEALAARPFLKHLKSFSLTNADPDKILDALSGSSAIEYVSLTGKQIKKEAIIKLADCPNLTRLDLRPDVVNMDTIDAIIALKKLDSVYLGDATVSAFQVKQLLKHCPNLKNIFLTTFDQEEILPIAQSNPRVKIVQNVPAP